MTNFTQRKIFAENLKRFIDKSGRTQAQVADDLNISRSTFNTWVNCERYPRVDKMELLANYFGCEFTDLTGNKTLAEGKGLEEYLVELGLNDAQMESVKNYVQWLLTQKHNQ